MDGLGDFGGFDSAPDAGTLGGTMSDAFGENSATLGGETNSSQADANFSLADASGDFGFGFGVPSTFSDSIGNPGFLGQSPDALQAQFDDSFLGKLHSLMNSPIGKMGLSAIGIANPALGLALGIGKQGLAGAAGKGAQSMGAGLGGALGSFAAGPVGGFLGSMAGGNAFGGFQGTGTAADAGFSSNGLGDGLLGLYGGYRSLQDANGVRSSLADMYGQNSPYAKSLRQQLERRDAAAGRRSQYGGREVELQAKLAGLMSQNAPAMLQANSQSAIARNLMLRNGLMAYRSLGSMFPGDSGAGSVPGGYDVGGQTYNNPSAYTAPSTESFWDNAAWPGFEGV